MRTTLELPSKEILDKLLKYDPITGILTRKILFRYNSRKICDAKLNNGYIYFVYKKKYYLAHRLIWRMMTGDDPEFFQIDHINGVRDDNSWKNLRLATEHQNQRNVYLAKNNTSGVKGVTWEKKRQCWQAQVSLNGKNIFLGYFRKLEHAAEVRRNYVEKLHGEFTNHGQ